MNRLRDTPLIAILGLTLLAACTSSNGTATTTTLPDTTTSTSAAATTTTVPPTTVPPTSLATTTMPPTTTPPVTTPTIAVPAGAPPLDLFNEDLVAATRSILDFKFWSDKNPVPGLASLPLWLDAEGPYFKELSPVFEERAAKGIRALGQPEILEVRQESNDGLLATVLVWTRSDGYGVVGDDGTNTTSAAYERTLAVVDLRRQLDRHWAVFDLRIPQTG
jgi:hypothetical protein